MKWHCGILMCSFYFKDKVSFTYGLPHTFKKTSLTWKIPSIPIDHSSRCKPPPCHRRSWPRIQNLQLPRSETRRFDPWPTATTETWATHTTHTTLNRQSWGKNPGKPPNNYDDKLENPHWINRLNTSEWSWLIFQLVIPVFRGGSPGP